MENTEKKPTLGRKIYIAAALFLILVGLPAVSWFYLRGGLNWRKDALAELSSWGQIRPAYIVWPDGTREDMLDGKVVVVHIFGENPDLTADNRKILDTCEKLFNQFGQTNHFRLAMVAQGGTPEFRSHFQTMENSEHATWVWTGAIGSWRTIIENGYGYFCRGEKIQPDPEYFALADTSGAIRRYYNALDDKQVERMVQHIAILLPAAE